MNDLNRLPVVFAADLRPLQDSECFGVKGVRRQCTLNIKLYEIWYQEINQTHLVYIGHLLYSLTKDSVKAVVVIYSLTTISLEHDLRKKKL